MKYQEVEIHLPEFKIKSSKYSLLPIMTKVMQEKGLPFPKEIFVLQHQALIQVDKQGTIAVAVSGGGGGAGSGTARQRGPIVIDINQPSEYFLVHKPSNEILFIGNLDDPTPI